MGVAPRTRVALPKETPLPVRQTRRVLRTGFPFALLRLLGIVLEAAGALISIAASVGFVLILVRLAPEFASAIQQPESRMAGFVTIIFLVWLLVPLAIALLGVVGIALGYVLCRVATRPPLGVLAEGEPPAQPTDIQEETQKGSA